MTSYRRSKMTTCEAGGMRSVNTEGSRGVRSLHTVGSRGARFLNAEVSRGYAAPKYKGLAAWLRGTYLKRDHNVYDGSSEGL